MVVCSAEVSKMTSAGLLGMLSPSIENLSQLRTMLLQNDQLLGPVLDEIRKLS